MTSPARPSTAPPSTAPPSTAPPGAVSSIRVRSGGRLPGSAGQDARRLMAAEFIKLRSLRSTRWTLAALVLTTIALGTLFCAETAAHWSHVSAADKATWDPTNDSLAGTLFGQLAVAVFGVLAVTAEFSSGTIRSSVAAAPRRVPLLAAKAAVYGGVALLLGEVASFTSYLVGQAIFSGRVPSTTLGDPGVIRAVAMIGAYLALIALIGLGIGLALRHTAGAISLMVALLLVLPGIVAVLPSSVSNTVSRFLPEQIASSSMGAVVPAAHSFSPWGGAGVMAAYTALAIGAGLWCFLRRDV